MSVIIFFLVLFILILVHEWGHFIMAKKTGMRVDEFGVGFPPKIFGVKKGETEYTLNSLPVGGFVRILGENGAVDGEELSETDKQRVFSARPKWAQALVLIAGVTMNIVFAWFLFVIIFMAGTEVVVDESEATENANLYIVNVLPDTPATTLPLYSVVTSVSADGVTVEKPFPTEFTNLIRSSEGRNVEVTYNHAEQTGLTVTLQPRQGIVTSDLEKYAVGASVALLEVKKMGLIDAVVSGFVSTWRGLQSICIGLYTLVSQAFVGDADFSQVAGPVGIVGMVGEAAESGFVKLLQFTAIISLNLAVINLLPFPALDGGRLVFVGIEAITRRPIPPAWAGRLNLVGFAILMLLMIAVTYNDILRLL